jgi:hypothetical protein
MDANSTIWMPTTHKFSWKIAKKLSKFMKRDVKRVKILYFCPISVISIAV